MRPAALVTLGAWFGLAAGLLEVVWLAIRHRSEPIMELSRDFLWMTPLALTAVTTLIGAVVAVASLGWKRLPAFSLVLFACVTTAALELLLYLPGLHHAGALLLAIGIGFQTARVLARRPGPVTSLARRTVPLLAGLVVLLGGGERGWRWLAERRALGALPAAAPRAPNVIVVSLDAVRAANLSLYGYSRPTTPNLDAFAGRGTVFDRAVTVAPWTLPSHASMFTGRWHHELSTGWVTPLDGTFPTLAEFLSSKGYATGGVVANMKYCGYETGLDRGFIRYHDFPVSLGQLAASSKVLLTALTNFRLRRLIQNDQHLVRKSAEEVNDAVADWIGAAGERPFFLFINYFDAHEPYLPPPPFDRKFGPGRRRGRLSPLHRWLWEPAMGHANMGDAEVQEELDAYDGAIAHLDDRLHQLLSRLEGEGRLENTLVVITADHGEEFGEHEVFDHGNSLYRAGVQVPLVIVGPGPVPRGLRVSQPVSLRDLSATIVDLLGLAAGSPFPGRSLARHWRAEGESPPEPPIFSQVNHAGGHPDWFPVSKGDMHSVVHQGFRYIRNGDGSEELFDFEGDPWERRDLAKLQAYGPSLAELRRILSSAVADPETSTAEARSAGGQAAAR